VNSNLLTGDTFLWALGAQCQLNRIPFDAQLILRQFPPPYDAAILQRALQYYGLHAILKKRQLDTLAQASLPCLALLKGTIADIPKSDTRPPQTHKVIRQVITLMTMSLS
jgi:hypothetical protein